MTKNIFSKEVSSEIVDRIMTLTPISKAQWGKMDVAKMLAHCCVTYEYIYEDKYPKPGFFKKWILKSFVKPMVVNDKPYKKSNPTAPDFIIKNDRNFEIERNRLINFINHTQELGAHYFDGKESHSFGKLNTQEWNNMFYKHLNHHLTQFGA